MSWVSWHEISERAASEAHLAVREGDQQRATEKFREAAEAESKALDDLDHAKLRTLGITVVSAVSLWFKAGELANAEQLARRFLASGHLPTFAVSQLRQLTGRGRTRQGEDRLAKVVVITSGKGGVGKTTTAAAFAAGLALRGHKTVVIDFDVGLRNLDLIMGCERRVVFDFINVINGDAILNQALIKDKRNDNLYIFPTSQTRDKDALKREGVDRVLEELKQQFDYIVCDSPAGIEHGAITALYFADAAIIVTNPEVSSVRDSDRIIGILASRSRRAERNEPPVELNLLLTRYDPVRVSKGEMLTVEDVKEILSIPLLGVIPESESVLRASNTGTPVAFDPESSAGRAYLDAVARFLGETREMRFVKPERRNFLRVLFGRA
jgi:septum site-determining protein MinD